MRLRAVFANTSAWEPAPRFQRCHHAGAVPWGQPSSCTAPAVLDVLGWPGIGAPRVYGRPQEIHSSVRRVEVSECLQGEAAGLGTLRSPKKRLANRNNPHLLLKKKKSRDV